MSLIAVLAHSLLETESLSARTTKMAMDLFENGAKTAEKRLLAKEKAGIVTKVLSALKQRDRNVLLDFFYNELSHDEVCKRHSVTREQLRLILFHARRRFQESMGREVKQSPAFAR